MQEEARQARAIFRTQAAELAAAKEQLARAGMAQKPVAGAPTVGSAGGVSEAVAQSAEPSGVASKARLLAGIQKEHGLGMEENRRQGEGEGQRERKQEPDEEGGA